MVMNSRLRALSHEAQSLLFPLLVFLVPTNLFLKFLVDRAYVGGILVDYLLPKLYLSDIFVFLLIISWCIELGREEIVKHLKSHSRIIAFAALFFVLHLFAHRSSQYLFSSVWFVFKLIEIWLFLAWIFWNKKMFNSDALFAALSSTILFQFALGVYQYLTQRSFFGYWFFGEPLLSVDPTIAKTEYSGALKILPYGTTPHPNILAGTLVMMSLLCMYLVEKKGKGAWRAIAAVLVLLSTIISILTDSTSAALALVSGVVMLFLFRSFYKRVPALLRVATVTLSLCVVVFIPLYLSYSSSAYSSFLRRNELERIALRMFAAEPFFGTGLNLFTTTMSGFGNVSANLRFLQPVHNVPLLLLTETGLFGAVFIVLILYFVHKKYSVNFFAFGVLGVPFSIIVSLDHYPLSVQSGVLLSAILLAVMMEKKKKLHR